MQVFVSRRPVFDQQERLVGYDLALRRTPSITGIAEPSPEKLVTDAFLGIGIDQVAAGRRAFVAVDRGMLVDGTVRLLPPTRVVLKIDGDIGTDAALLDTCERLARAGYCFCVSSAHPETIPVAILGFSKIVRVDVATMDAQRLGVVARWLRGHRQHLLAANVRHSQERDACATLGFEMFEGYRFTAPEVMACRDLPVGLAAAFRLLKMVRDPKSTDTEIEDVLNRDVSLSYKLLRMVNSGAVGGRSIWSTGHAFRILGRDRVAAWLGLLIVTDGGRAGVQSELVRLSLARARMCEMLAAASGVPRAGPALYLVGMFSLLDQLIEMPIETLVDSIDVAPDIRGALLRREDFFGEALALVEAYEEGEWSRVETLSRGIGVEPMLLPPLYLDALRWAAEQLGQCESIDGGARSPTGTSNAPRNSGGIVADRYRVIKLLGEGGMGRVYLAEHTLLGRKSALKVMSAATTRSASAVSRFHREAANASRINHPNVAQIYDFGETEDGTLYLAMEFVEGETLAGIIAREGTLSPDRAARLTEQVANGLAAAHALGIVHRDIKPENIMVTRGPDGTEQVKVVDFGIAKSMRGVDDSGSQTVTTAGVSVGTPDFMSPEQLGGDLLDYRTDLYSLGLVVFKMLTGALPFSRITSKELLVERLTVKARPLASVAPGFSWPDGLQAALDRALAVEVADRCSSAVELARDVAAAVFRRGGFERTMPLSIVEHAGPGRLRQVAPLPPSLAPRRRSVATFAAGIVDWLTGFAR